jgi:hypothetical protein
MNTAMEMMNKVRIMFLDFFEVIDGEVEEVETNQAQQEQKDSRHIH